jgi:serine/threonine protein kinase
MGAVYRANQISLERTVAVKVLTPHLAKNENYLKRFQREARAVAKLNHPNVVSGIDVGESKGCRFFVMEYVEGPTLLQLLEKDGRLDAMSATRIILQIARALDHAHKAGLVHRDVKPANIIVTTKHNQSVAKLCDLGLAKEVTEGGADTGEGRAMGTPFYISPEQARGAADIDIRSDIYSLGATYYHAVCGRTPFTGPTPAVIMAKHLTEPVVPVRRVVQAVPPASRRHQRARRSRAPGATRRPEMKGSTTSSRAGGSCRCPIDQAAEQVPQAPVIRRSAGAGGRPSTPAPCSFGRRSRSFHETRSVRPRRSPCPRSSRR